MEKEKKAIYKRWWFWLIIIVLVILIGAGSSSDNNQTTSTNIYGKDNSVEVVVADFATMTRDEVETWFNANKINGKIADEYSSTIAKGNFVKQSIEVNKVIHEGDKITVVYSLGKEPSTEEKNALKKAESYSKMMHMSKQSIYDQLTSEYGEKFSADAAQYAIDNMQADFKANALEKAKSYQTTMSMSRNAIYDQLISQYGEKFTKEEAQYAIDHLDN